MKCPNCGATIKPGQEFCEECGNVCRVEQGVDENGAEYTQYEYHADREYDLREPVESPEQEEETVVMQADGAPELQTDPVLAIGQRQKRNEEVQSLKKAMVWGIVLDLVCIMSMIVLEIYPVMLAASLGMEWYIRKRMKALGLWKKCGFELYGEERAAADLYSRYKVFFIGSLFPVIMAVLVVGIIVIVGFGVMIFGE